MTINKPDEIEKIMKEGQFKYVELVSRDKRYGGYNNTPGALKDKINQIKKFLISLPDDIYYLNFKINTKGDVFQYTYNKGNKPMNEAPHIPIVYNSAPLEKFQTLEEWKKQEQRINELEKELELMRLKEQFKGMNEAPAKEPEKNVFLGFAENVLPTFVPFLDKYFQLKEKELNLKEKQNNRIVLPKKKVLNKFRPVPDTADPNFQNYLKYFEALPDHLADQEVQFLQVNKPDIYKLIIDQFYESE